MSKRRRRKAQQIKALIVVIAVLILAGCIYAYGYKEYKAYMKDYAGTETFDGEDVTVEIPEGSSVKKIAKILHENGLITYENAFVNRVKESEYRGKLKFGTYTLNTGMNTMQMIELMGQTATGPEVLQTLTIPEGYSIEQIAVKVAEQKICTSEEFLEAVNAVDRYDYSFISELPVKDGVKYRLQGCLFPATYNIYASTTAESLVDTMLKKFSEVYASVSTEASSAEFNTYELITIASIIEREAKLDSERPTISGVLYNRIHSNMPLQMCPTVLYPLTDGMYDKTEVTYSDLEIDSPYNTYRNPGLPIGPICNPGETSLRAAMSPESHSYLYYHTDSSGDGSHIFTETYEEHLETQH